MKTKQHKLQNSRKDLSKIAANEEACFCLEFLQVTFVVGVKMCYRCVTYHRYRQGVYMRGVRSLTCVLCLMVGASG
jgi:hypothetical protein